MEDYINALKEIEKEDESFKLTLSKKEVLDIIKEFDRLREENKQLKEERDNYQAIVESWE